MVPTRVGKTNKQVERNHADMVQN